MRRARGRGVFLVVIVAVEVLLVLTGILFLRVVAIGSGGVAARRAACAAGLCAASGMEYAAARLAESPYPRVRETPESRGDDWSCRDPRGTPLERVANPSFSHGEAWVHAAPQVPLADDDADGRIDEAAELQGRFDAGDAAGPDRDGDGGFSSWSARLREGRAFLLRIEGDDGKIPLNAGCLWGGDGIDNDGDGVLDEADEADGIDNDSDGAVDEAGEWPDLHGGAGPGYGANNVPDHRDVLVPYHAGLVRALNNLGVVAGLSTRCDTVPIGTAADPASWLKTSWLGHDLIANRPPGGYRSWAQAESVLKGLANPLPHEQGGVYSQAECDAIRPFLSLGPYGDPGEGGRVPPATKRRIPDYVPVNLWTAPPEVLKSVWMYVSGRAGSGTVSGTFPGDVVGYRSTPYGRAGTMTYDWTYMGQPMYARPAIWPDEAAEIASLAVEMRQAGILTWKGLYQRLADEAQVLFRKDVFDFAPDDPADGGNGDGLPNDPYLFPNAGHNIRHWTGAKTDVAFRAVAMDAYPYPGAANGCTTWASWGVDRDRDPSAPGIDAASYVDAHTIGYVKYPAYFDPDHNPAPWSGWVNEPYRHQQGEAMTRVQGFTLSAPKRFRVESAARGAPSLRMEGTLRAAEVLELFCQEDFEQLSAGWNLARRGIEAAGSPGPQARRDTRAEPAEGRAAYPHILTFPRWDRRSFTPAVEAAPGWGFSRMFGAVALGRKESGVQGAGRYLSFTDDWETADATLDAEGSLPSFPYQPSWQWGIGNDDLSTHPLYNNMPLIPSVQCPGIDGPFGAGTGIDGLSIEAWVGPGAGLRIAEQGAGANYIELNVSRPQASSPNPHLLETIFRLTVGWKPAAVSPPMINNALWCTMLDDPALGWRSWFHHVLLTLTYNNVTARTEFRLYIDGQDTVEGIPIPMKEYAKRMEVTDLESFLFRGADQIRVYAGAKDQAFAKQRYEQERFVRLGTYTSPLFRCLDGPVRLLRARWTGSTPPAFYLPLDPSDPVRSLPDEALPLDPFRVSLRLYDASGAELPAPQSPLPLDASESSAALRSLPPVRLFRCEVRIDCQMLAGVLDDTPVFESIWLTLQRAGHAPAWTGWTVR